MNKLTQKLGLLRIAILLCLFVFWYVLHIFNTFLIPTPWQTLHAGISILGNGEILDDFGNTLYRVLVSFLQSLVISIPIGVSIGMNKTIYKSVAYIIDFFRSIPATALFPIFMIIFGVGDESKIASAVIASSLVIIFNLAEGVAMIHPQKIHTMKLFGASWFQILTKMTLYESLPYIFIGIRNGVSLALVVIVVTEMFVGTNSGLGKSIIDYQITYEISKMYATVFLVGFLGYSLNKSIQLIEKRIVHWRV